MPARNPGDTFTQHLPILFDLPSLSPLVLERTISLNRS